jgi:hypothetical protein
MGLFVRTNSVGITENDIRPASQFEVFVSLVTSILLLPLRPLVISADVYLPAHFPHIDHHPTEQTI